MSNQAIVGGIFLPLCSGCLLGCYDGEPKDADGPIMWEITFKVSRCNCTICHHRPAKRDSRPKDE